MLTSCKEELPNAHRNCVHKILSALICYDNDLRRINTELRNIQYEYKDSMQKINFGNLELNETECKGSDTIIGFTKKINIMHDLNQYFSRKTEGINKIRAQIISDSRQCFLTLNSEKCKFKQFHENTIDYLKKYAIKSNDAPVINNCEKDICELHKLFTKEVAIIKKCEIKLQSFFKQCTYNMDMDCCCCFKDYIWLPKDKSLHVLYGLSAEIKCVLGSTISRAFSHLHARQAFDVKPCLAAYLMNLEHNEQVLREKLYLFGSLS